MTLYNVGSIATDAGNFVGWSTIPNISGTALNNIVTQEINFANSYGNFGIGTTDIAPNFQPVLIDLTVSKLLIAIKAQQGTLETVKLGELWASQGQTGTEFAKQMRDNAIQRLQELGRYVRFAKVYGA